MQESYEQRQKRKERREQKVATINKRRLENDICAQIDLKMIDQEIESLKKECEEYEQESFQKLKLIETIKLRKAERDRVINRTKLS